MLLKTSDELGFYIKSVRREQNLSQVQLARLCNVGVRFISDLENGKKTCEIEKVLKVLDCLGISVNIEYKGLIYE